MQSNRRREETRIIGIHGNELAASGTTRATPEEDTGLIREARSSIAAMTNLNTHVLPLRSLPFDTWVVLRNRLSSVSPGARDPRVEAAHIIPSCVRHTDTYPDACARVRPLTVNATDVTRYGVHLALPNASAVGATSFIRLSLIKWTGRASLNATSSEPRP